ncbi:hypothetical protein BAY59_26515 [Prauserella coralliicola]|nr:hypothetical protein BAY59_26515 [Prauserella coralliicola]
MSAATAGRVALVTGSSGGIGKGIALRLAEAGVAVAVVARKDPKYPGTVEQTVDEIRAAGGKAEGFDCDLSVPEQRGALAGQVTGALGPVDILVNNAAVSVMRPVAEFSDKHFSLMFDVQVRAPFQLAQSVIPSMRERGRGWIINVSSGAANHPMPEAANAYSRTDTVYGMCKAAVERFSSGLAAELYDDRINVNAISPVNVVPSHGASVHPPAADYLVESPLVMGEAVRYLCDPSSPRITGRILQSQYVLLEAGIAVPR